MKNQPIAEAERENIKEVLMHCPEGTYEALDRFRSTGDVDSFHQFLTGVLERFVEPEDMDLLGKDHSTLNFVEDLGIDSMTMMEIVIVVEECLGIEMANEALIEVETYGDLDQFISQKLNVE